MSIRLSVTLRGAFSLFLLAVLGQGIYGQTTISFSTLTEGTVASNQFPGVTISTSPLVGTNADLFYAGSIAGPQGGDFASNTDLTVTATDVGSQAPSLSGVRILHAFGNIYSGWLDEDDHPNFRLLFSAPISSLVIRFSGDTDAASGFAVLNGTTLGAAAYVPAGANTVIKTASLGGLNNTDFVVVPGSFNDWVSVVDITYTLAAVPEPGTIALIAGAGGIAGIAMFRHWRGQGKKNRFAKLKA